MTEKYGIMVKGIVTFDDKVLLLRKWYDDRIGDPYQWEFIDGKLEFGEEPDKAVIRAVNHNTGLLPDIEDILYAWSYVIGEKQNIGVAYLCNSLVDDIILSEEYTDYIWVSKSEIKDYITNNLILKDLERIDFI